MSRRSILILGVVVLALAAGLAAWLMLGSPSVEVVHPTRGPAVQAVYATGTVEPTIMTPISPRIGARLVELDTDEGADVTKGQILARLESGDLQNSMNQLIAQADFARRDYLRDAAMVKGGIIPRQTYDKAKSAWEAANAAVAAAKAQLQFMMLTAPGDCHVIQRDGEVGQFIPINQPVFWLSCHSPLRISAEVDEEDISLVNVGQKVLIRADAFPGKIFDGRVLSITPKGDPVARSYRVRISIGDAPLRVGMTAETNIIVHTANNALLIPATALADGKVWKVENDTLSQAPVNTGAKGDEEIEILSGVLDGDLIVRQPDATLKQGARVRTSVK